MASRGDLCTQQNPKHALSKDTGLQAQGQVLLLFFEDHLGPEHPLTDGASGQQVAGHVDPSPWTTLTTAERRIPPLAPSMCCMNLGKRLPSPRL